MTFQVHIPNWGFVRTEADSEADAIAQFQVKRPGAKITAVPARDRKQSAEEIAAEEEAD